MDGSFMEGCHGGMPRFAGARIKRGVQGVQLHGSRLMIPYEERTNRERIVQFCVRRMAATLSYSKQRYTQFKQTPPKKRSPKLRDDAEFYAEESGNALLLAAFLSAHSPWVLTNVTFMMSTWLKEPATSDPATVILAAQTIHYKPDNRSGGNSSDLHSKLDRQLSVNPNPVHSKPQLQSQQYNPRRNFDVMRLQY